MKLPGYEMPKSSFLSVQKDLNLIIDKILSSVRLQKLLFYNVPNALTQPNLTEEEKISLFQKNIKVVPKLFIDGSVLSYIIISFDNFTTNTENPEFRDNIISFDIICHYDQWKMQDSLQLRPYLIAAELDSALSGKRLTGIGELQFLSCNQLIINDEFAGLSLMYQAIHGGEDNV